jgi:hypothetical protein
MVRVLAEDHRLLVGRLLAPWPGDGDLRLCRDVTVACGSAQDPSRIRLDPADIRTVQVARGSQWRRGLAIGAGVGLLAGVALAVLIDNTECDDCARQPAGWPAVPLGMVSFALIGAGVGAAHPRWIDVWSARPQ